MQLNISGINYSREILVELFTETFI